jgi:hypothetical protein
VRTARLWGRFKKIAKKTKSEKGFPDKMVSKNWNLTPEDGCGLKVLAQNCESQI